MTTIYLEANWVFSIEDLASDMKAYQEETGFTDAECNAAIGTATAWASIRNMNGEYHPSKTGRVSMLTFLNIVNLIETDARRYFKLDRSLE